jgi:hypothetical protein
MGPVSLVNWEATDQCGSGLAAPMSSVRPLPGASSSVDTVPSAQGILASFTPTFPRAFSKAECHLLFPESGSGSQDFSHPVLLDV